MSGHSTTWPQAHNIIWTLNFQHWHSYQSGVVQYNTRMYNTTPMHSTVGGVSTATGGSSFFLFSTGVKASQVPVQFGVVNRDWHINTWCKQYFIFKMWKKKVKWQELLKSGPLKHFDWKSSSTGTLLYISIPS